MPKLQSRFRSVTVIFGLIASADLFADEMLELPCELCRHPNVHPSDFGNFAFNVATKPNNGYTYDQIDKMKIKNPAEQWAIVDLDFGNVTFPIADIPIPIPNGTINITVTDQNGNVTKYGVPYDIEDDLKVGTGIGPGYNPTAEAYMGSQSGELGEESQGIEIIEPGAYNDDSMVEIGGGIGIPDTGNYCGPGTDYVCVY